MEFNFIIISVIIALTAYRGMLYTRSGLKDWYLKLQKPWWTPTGKQIGEIWTWIYIITGISVLWFWNVPAYGWWHYGIGGLLLVNAAINIYWSKVFFVEHNFRKAYKTMMAMNGLTIVTAICMLPFSYIAPFLLLPYIVWVGIATRLTLDIEKLNKK